MTPGLSPTRGWHLPVEGHGGKWDGLAGFSRWHADAEEARAITGGEPVRFDGCYPDFSPWAQKSYEFDNLTGGNSDFSEADRRLAEELNLGDRAAGAIYRSERCLTWHHHQDGRTLLLLPRALHSAVPHAGGATLLRAVRPPVVLSVAQNTRRQTALRISGGTSPVLAGLDSLTLATPRLPKRAWAPDNHQSLLGWLSRIAHEVPESAQHVAIYDWDHTAIAGECGPLVFHFMLQKLALQITPDQIGQFVPVPNCPAVAFLNGMSIAPLRQDIIEAYSKLHALQGNLEAAVRLSAYRDFTSKVGVYCQQYDAISPTMRRDGPLWMRWFSGFKPDALGKLAVEAARASANEGIRKRRWTSASEGASGAVEYIFEDGVAPRPEMIDLMRAMRSVGVRPCVVTGGVEPMVRALASAWKYPVNADDIIGTRYERDEAGKLTRHLLCNKDRPATYGIGKTQAIRKFIGQPPVFVAGDSDGDYDMLTAFKETQVRLIMNAHREGTRIATLYERREKPLQLVQNSDDHSGQFVTGVEADYGAQAA